MQADTAKDIATPADTSTLNTQLKITVCTLGQHGPGYKAPKSAKTTEGTDGPESVAEITLGLKDNTDPESILFAERPAGDRRLVGSAMVPPNAPSLCPLKLQSAMDSTNKDVAAEARAALEFYKFGQRFEILSVPVRAEGPRVFVKPDSPAVDDKDVSVYLDTAEDIAALDSYKFGPRTFADPQHDSKQPLFVREHPKGAPLCAMVQDYSSRSLVIREVDGEDPLWKHHSYLYSLPGPSAKPSDEVAIERTNPTQETLNAAYAAYELKPEDANLEEFYRQLFFYVRRKAFTGRGHNTLIKSDIAEDVSADFVMHIKEKLEAGKFHNKSPFCNWVNKCWVNFRNTDLTKEGKRLEKFVQLVETRGGRDFTAPEDGYRIGMQDLAMAREYQRDLNKVPLLEGLEVDETSLAVAGCLGAGMNQNETANELGISPYLVREAKKDLARALLPKLAVISKAAADSGPLGTVTDLCALCANMSDTSRPSTITVGRGKKSHFDEHKQDKHFFRCVGSFGA